MFENPFESRSYLVIDDFGDMRTMIKGVLRSLGGQDIDAARNGKEALEMMARRRYDAVLCDYNLGSGKNGQQVLEEARKRRLINIATVFVMVTAENTREMVMGAVEYEPDSYLSKPFTKDLLRSRLEKIFQRKADLGPVNAALEKKDYATALKLLDERLASKPKNAGELIKQRADICYQSGDYASALRIYDRQLAVRAVPWAQLGLGKVQYAKKEYVDAKETFSNLLRDNKAMTSAYDWLAKTQRALGHLDDAQATLSTAIKLSPKAIQRQQSLGDVAMQNHDHSVAEKAFSSAVKLGRNSAYNHPSMYAGLARSQSAQGKHEAALESTELIEDVFDDDAARFYAATASAIVKQNSGDTDGAAEAIERAERINQRSPGALSASAQLELVKAASALGEQDKANELLRQIVQNNHDDEEILGRVAGACREIGLHEDPDALISSLRQQVIKMNNKGVKLIKAGQYAQAIELFHQAAEGIPSNRIINLNMARACVMKMEKGGVESELVSMARKYLDRVRKVHPDDDNVNQVMRRFQALVSA